MTAHPMARRTALFLLGLAEIAIAFSARSPAFGRIASRGISSGATDSPERGRFSRRTPKRSAGAMPALPTDERELIATTESGVFVVDSMPPPLPPLNNDYYLLRHGQSWGNVENVISSARSLAASEKHGLTDLGYEQGLESAENLLGMISSDLLADEDDDGAVSGGRKKKRVFFYSSPFARARQTAQACMEGLAGGKNRERAEELGLDVQSEMLLEDGIMERYFGELDDAPIGTYNLVWPVDMANVTNTEYDVESVAAVSTRVRNVLTKIDSDPRHDERHGRDIIVLVSHADVLQITQLYAAGAENVGNFSSYRFANGEVRAMRRTPDSLPEPEPLPLPNDA